jgi:hypothetical protein
MALDAMGEGVKRAVSRNFHFSSNDNVSVASCQSATHLDMGFVSDPNTALSGSAEKGISIELNPIINLDAPLTRIRHDKNSITQIGAISDFQPGVNAPRSVGKEGTVVVVGEESPAMKGGCSNCCQPRSRPTVSGSA